MGRSPQAPPALNPPQPSTLDPLEMALLPPGRPLVAVMPFVATVDDPQLRLLGTEIADTLRERLASEPQLQAILISSEFLAKAPPHALELVCRELRVGYLVSGKCHPAGGQPSLYIEVADTREWHVQWAQFVCNAARSLVIPGSKEMDDLVFELRDMLVRHPAR